MKIHGYKILVLLLLVSFTSKAQNKFSSSEIGNFRDSFKSFIEKKMKKHDVTGLSIAVEVENKLVYSDGFGLSDKKNNIKTKKDTEYPIGSVSKIITSTAILKLCSDGLIDLDDSYKTHVSDFSMRSHSVYKDFTIRQLLSHYSGLPRLLAKGFLRTESQSLEELLQKSKDEYLITSPGKVYQYSDWGVDLLALLIERVSGMPYEKYIAGNIFEPLDMRNSYFGPVKNTKGYYKGKEIGTYEYSYSGSDGAVSSAEDLIKIVRLYTNKGKILNEKFIDAEMADEAIKIQFSTAELAYDTNIGLMWDVRPLKNGYTRIKKAGIHEPFYTYIFSIPELDASIAICSNSNSDSSIHWVIWSKFYGLLSKKNNFPNYQGPKKQRSNLKKIKLSDKKLKQIEGTYNTSIGILELIRNNNRFDVNLKSEDKKGIGVTYTDGLIKLYVKTMGIKLHAMDIFWKEVDGDVVLGEQYKSGSRNVFGAKVNAKPIPTSWKNAVGTYEVINYSDKEYRTFDKVELFINENNILELLVKVKFPQEMKFRLALSTLSDGLSVIPGYNFDFFAGETVKLDISDEGKHYLTLSGYKLEKQ